MINWPFCIENNKLKTTTTLSEKVKQSIFHRLSTEQGERAIFKSYGTPLKHRLAGSLEIERDLKIFIKENIFSTIAFKYKINLELNNIKIKLKKENINEDSFYNKIELYIQYKFNRSLENDKKDIEDSVKVIIPYLRFPILSPNEVFSNE